MESNETQAPETQAPAAADTVETQDTSKAGDSQVSVPEVAEESKDETAVKTEDTTQEKLYAGKYKTPEDMEKAYTELQSKFGKETSEKAELTRALSEAFATPAPQVAETEADPYAEPTADPRIDVLERKTAVATFAMAHPDADGVAMKDILASDPLVAQITGNEAKLEYAYLKARAVSQPKAVAEAAKEAKAQTVQKIAEKEIAQVESAKKAEPANESKLEKVLTGSHSEIQEATRALIREQLVNL